MKSYEQTLNLFVRYMDDTFKILSHKKVNAEHLRAYMRSLSERGQYEVTLALKPVNYSGHRQGLGKPVTQTTIGNYTRNIKAFYGHLEAEHIIRKNPMLTVQNVEPELKRKLCLKITSSDIQI